MRLAWVLAFGSVLLGPSCSDSKKTVQERQKKLEQARRDEENRVEAERKAQVPKVEPAHLEPFWDDPSFLKVTTGRPCPDGVWTLFPGPAPGEGEAQLKAEAQRAELSAKIPGATFVTVLRLGAGVTLLDYSTAKKAVPIEVDGMVECVDGAGIVSMAWGKPSVLRSGADPEELAQQSVWRAKPSRLYLPVASKAEAQEFRDKTGVGLQARVVFRLGEIQLDRHVTKVAKPLEPDAGEAFAPMDWGAGRLVRAQVLGVRLATDHEKVLVLEHKGDPSPPAPEKPKRKPGKKRKR